MTDIVDPGHIEEIVGAPRSLAHHYGRAVSAEQRIYILHSKVCLDSGVDLRNCPFSVALDLGESQVVPLQRDVPILLGITADGLLADLTLASILRVDAVAHATPSAVAASLGPGTERHSRRRPVADSAPHIARATEEMRSRFGAAWMAHDDARAVVSAALHDPSDPDKLAREYVARMAHESWATGCQRVCFHAVWDDMDELARNTIRAQLDAMSAVVLGVRDAENGRG